MAGGTGKGPVAAVEGLFEGRPCVMTGGDEVDVEVKERVKCLWEGLGMIVQEMEPGVHDQQVACISHLPHVIATAIVSCAKDRGAMSVASTGFRDTTRVASGNPLIWRDIFITNKEAIVESIDDFTAKLNVFRQMLVDDDTDLIIEDLEQLKEERDVWVKSQFGDIKEQ